MPDSQKKTFREVFDLILERQRAVESGNVENAKKSYVASLFSKGTDKILKKVGEEAAEVIIAAKGTDRDEQVHELADLWFHMMVLMADLGLKIEDLEEELGGRFGTSGLVEKANRPSE